MSLNGLDSPAVNEAYQSAIAEAGGWFLLKYTSRDAVELLGQGRNGVAEARNAISAYTETSPLYGLLMYRRRKILVKHIPEGTSRLLQARTTVHLSDILERYSPYETLLEISTADGLNDTALAASFQLHTASRPSPSPIPSSRLHEIREDGEDGGAIAGLPPLPNEASSGMTNAQRYKAERRAEQLLRTKAEKAERASSLHYAAVDSPLSTPPHLSQSAAAPLKPSVSQFLVRDELGLTSVTPLEAPFARESGVESWPSRTSTKDTESQVPAPIVTDTEASASADVSRSSISPERPSHQPNYADKDLPPLPEPEPATEWRSSTSGKTTSMDERSMKASLEEDPYDLRKYDEWFKPKVKLAPRPVTSLEKSKRPAAARVSALPPTFKPIFKKQQEPPRPPPHPPQSHQQQQQPPPPPKFAATQQLDNPLSSSTPLTVPFKPLPPPVPDEPEHKPRPVSRGSIKSTPSYKSVGMTPDKLRLMKAIEFRKRQLRQSQGQRSARLAENGVEVPATLSELETLPVKDLETKKQGDKIVQATTIDVPTQASKADSGIDLQDGKPEQLRADDQSESQQAEGLTSNAHPNTAVLQQHKEHEGTIEPKQIDHGTEKDLLSTPASAHADPISPAVSEAPTETAASIYESADEMVPVPALVMADGSRPETSPSDTSSPASAPMENNREDDPSASNQSLEPPVSPRRQNSDLARRRRGLVEPLQLETGSGNPDDFVSDDEDFMDELHAATVQEAKPVMVSKSNILTRRPSAETVGSIRSVNITRTTTSDRLAPDVLRRPVSPASPTRETSESRSAVSRNVSSGISKRIQALAEKSNKTIAPEGFPPEHRERRLPSKARPTSYRRQSSHRGVSPISGSPNHESGAVWSVQHDPATNRNSVSVTARIVRPNAADEGLSGAPGLRKSELRINTGDASDTRVPPPIEASKSPSAVSSPPLSPTFSSYSGDVRQVHSSSRFGRKKQSLLSVADSVSPSNLPRNTSTTSLASNTETVTPKEGGRTSRFLKRMSNIGFGSGAKHRNNAPHMISPVSTAGSSTAGERVSQKKYDRLSNATDKMDMPPAVLVGDLNVQFSDSLLWKRRLVTVDESGNLLFTIAQAMEVHKGVAPKKYPLSVFQQPYAPDVDVEELANSLVLEFHDGTSLQLACEDAMTQRQVLHLLKTYWKAWTSTS